MVLCLLLRERRSDRTRAGLYLGLEKPELRIHWSRWTSRRDECSAATRRDKPPYRGINPSRLRTRRILLPGWREPET